MPSNSTRTESERQDKQNDQTDVIQLHAAGASSNVADAPVVRRVFISHKGKDKVAAAKIREDLNVYGGLDIFLSERIGAGIPWAGEIWDSLNKADWLILLYTDPSEEWDWCLFEAGFFAGRAQQGEHRLVCLHTTDVPPPMPLQHWQSVPVTDAEMLENFLRALFTGVRPELVQSATKIQQLADEIAGAFLKTAVRKLESKWVTGHVILSLNSTQVEELNTSGRVPGDATAGDEEKESLGIFGRGKGKFTWKELEGGLQEKLREWWSSLLGKALRKASLNLSPIPPIPDLYSPHLNKEYHVTLHRFDRFSDGSLKFCLIFHDKMTESEVGRTSDLRIIGDMLQLGRSFRWKILEKHHREISVLKQRDHNEVNVRRCLNALKSLMEWIVGESMRLGILIKEDVVNAFENEDDRNEIEIILTDMWPSLFSSLMHNIETRNLEEVLNALNGMRCMNKKFMVLSARRYEQLLKRLPEPSFTMPNGDRGSINV